jgi:hypothetical protein
MKAADAHLELPGAFLRRDRGRFSPRESAYRAPAYEHSFHVVQARIPVHRATQGYARLILRRDIKGK